MKYGCTYNDELSCSGSKCISVDFNGDHGTDHFYSGKSVSCGISRTLYVRGCDFVLRSYQKFLILICMLIFCFPVYAEDEAYEFQYIGNEALALQGDNVNQILYDYYINDKNERIVGILSEPLADPDLKNELDDYRVYLGSSDNEYRIQIRGSGYAFNQLDGIIALLYDDRGNVYEDTGGSVGSLLNFRTRIPSSDTFTLQYIDLLNTNNAYDRFNFFENINSPFSFKSYTTNTYGGMLSYTSVVSEVFTWIINHIGDLITFILDNAFLSVSLLLFMCGAAISFFVKVKRS